MQCLHCPFVKQALGRYKLVLSVAGPAASSGHVTDYASFDGVYCGTETMALSCAAAITVHNTQLRWTDKLQLAVRFTVRSAGVAPTPIWSEALEVARVDAKNTASLLQPIVIPG